MNICQQNNLNYKDSRDVYESEEIWNTKQMLIFLIDCTEKMFQQDPTFFHYCLQCCKFTYLSKIRNSSKDLLSIVFFGTQSKDAGDQNPQYITTFSQAKSPNAEIIQKLDETINNFNYDSFQLSYGHSNNFSIADALWHCSSIVTHCKYKISCSTIFLMTCEDNPHNACIKKNYQARKKALDLETLGIKLQLLYLGDQFNVNLFYSDILQAVNNDGTQFMPLPLLCSADDLPECIVKEYYKKRSMGKIPFYIGNTFIGVEIYNFYRRRKLPQSVKLDRTVNEPVTSIQKNFDSETGEQLLRSDMNRYCVIAQKRISFTKDETLKLSSLSKPGLRLFGFKSMFYLSPELYFLPSCFIFPSEDIVCGSKLLFCELLYQCISKEKFAVASLVSRYKGKPHLVALIPQQEIVNDSGKQHLPAGFHMIYLPYAENIREPPVQPISDITTEQQHILNSIVKKLSCSTYVPSMIRNPKLAAHWCNIEILALNCPESTVFDDTQIEHDEISERLGKLETLFKNRFTIEDCTTKSNKRKAPGSSNVSLKVQKSETKDASLVEKLAADKNLEQLTVNDLKNFLKSEGIKIMGNCKKCDLINMVYEHLNL